MVGVACGNTGGSRRVFYPVAGVRWQHRMAGIVGRGFDGVGDGVVTRRWVVRVLVGWVYLSSPKAVLGSGGTSVPTVSNTAAGLPWPCRSARRDLLFRGERLERARRERRGTTGFGPAVFGVSAGWVRVVSRSAPRSRLRTARARRSCSWTFVSPVEVARFGSSRAVGHSRRASAQGGRAATRGDSKAGRRVTCERW